MELQLNSDTMLSFVRLQCIKGIQRVTVKKVANDMLAWTHLRAAQLMNFIGTERHTMYFGPSLAESQPHLMSDIPSSIIKNPIETRCANHIVHRHKDFAIFAVFFVVVSVNGNPQCAH